MSAALCIVDPTGQKSLADHAALIHNFIQYRSVYPAKVRLLHPDANLADTTDPVYVARITEYFMKDAIQEYICARTPLIVYVADSTAFPYKDDCLIRILSPIPGNNKTRLTFLCDCPAPVFPHVFVSKRYDSATSRTIHTTDTLEPSYLRYINLQTLCKSPVDGETTLREHLIANDTPSSSLSNLLQQFSGCVYTASTQASLLKDDMSSIDWMTGIPFVTLTNAPDVADIESASTTTYASWLSGFPTIFTRYVILSEHTGFISQAKAFAEKKGNALSADVLVGTKNDVSKVLSFCFDKGNRVVMFIDCAGGLDAVLPPDAICDRLNATDANYPCFIIYADTSAQKTLLELIPKSKPWRQSLLPDKLQMLSPIISNKEAAAEVVTITDEEFSGRDIQRTVVWIGARTDSVIAYMERCIAVFGYDMVLYHLLATMQQCLPHKLKPDPVYLAAFTNRTFSLPIKNFLGR